ncbi:hypothetical protein [Salsuginibacillus kocurii]|uniref:hypothetical protein n=1 Tax=Salsuginibacillus kocurii TaxID=427078 RepID=UPI001F0B0288|nr:hypothetical protein [Salsuginibacillus kocurii]
MEDRHKQFIAVLAGYPEEMERFFSMNSGLPSRFPIVVDFPSYSVAELLKIADGILRSRDFYLTDQAREQLTKLIQKERYRNPRTFSNGRFVRHAVERMIRSQAIRLLETGKKYDELTLKRIEKEDVADAETDGKGWMI